MKKKKIKISAIIIFIIMIVLAVSTIYPLFFMVLNSLKTKINYMQDPFGLPAKVIFQNYVLLFKQYGVLSAIKNSFFTTIVSIIITGFFGSLASFALAKLRFKGKEAIFMFISAFMMVPVAVLMIPIYVQFSGMNLINNPWGIIIFWSVIDLPYGIYMMTGNLKAIPNDCIESVKIDGGSLFKIFTSIVLPMGKPIIVTMVIIYFMWNWNDLLMPMILLQSENTVTLTVAVATIVGKYFSNLPLLLAGLAVNTIPTVLIYLVFQKFIIKGVTEGAIK